MKRSCILISMVLCSCSHVDTGEIDYRRAEQPTLVAKSAANYSAGDCKLQEKAVFFGKTTEPLIRAAEEPCLPMLAGKLFRKNLSTVGARIVKPDTYSIRLEHGLISFMTEPGFSPERIFYGKRSKVQVGEIVILANVFEFGEDAKDKSFVDLTNLSEVKVIYYSPDVEARQDLNFSNIPLKAPATYNGNPIGIQIIVLELDRMSSQMQSLLKTLAGLGQQSNLAPTGPVGGLLLDLGTSMLTQNNDDTIFEYRFVLDPSDGSLSAQSAPFESGRYVIKRTHDRREDQIWRNLVVDHNTGRLMRVASDGDRMALVAPTPFTDETYFTLNVIKHPSGTTASAYGFRTLDQLGEEIKAASADRDAPFADADAALKSKLSEMRRASRAEEVVAAWRAASSKFRDYGLTINPDPDGKQCEPIPDLARRSGLAKFEAATAAVSFHQAYRDAVLEKDAAGTAVFKPEHKRKILAMMAPFFMPQTENSISGDELVDVDAFERTYADAAFSPLVKAMNVMAESQWRAQNCDEFVAAGLAVMRKPAGG